MTRLSERPALSIVVPTVDDTAALEETLVSILENRPADCEIIVPIACRYDDPWNIGEEVRFVVAPPHASFVACTNLGIAASRGRVIHVLAAGWRATHGWAEAALASFDDLATGLRHGMVAAVVPLVVSAQDRARVVSTGVRLTAGGRRVRLAPKRERANPDATDFDVSAVRPSAPRVEAGFWRADALAVSGTGFAADCGDVLCDVDMAVTIEAVRGRVTIATDARVVEGPAVVEPNAFVHGVRAERVFWRSLAERPLLASLLLHGWEVVRSALATAPLGTLPMLLGRAVALLQFGSYFAHARHMRAVRAAREDDGAVEPTTVRIDQPHASLRKPRGHGRGEPPLRKSA